MTALSTSTVMMMIFFFLIGLSCSNIAICLIDPWFERPGWLGLTRIISDEKGKRIGKWEEAPARARAGPASNTQVSQRGYINKTAGKIIKKYIFYVTWTAETADRHVDTTTADRHDRRKRDDRGTLDIV